MGNEYICIIDRGTTNVKAVLFDLCGKERYVSSASSQTPAVLHKGWFEQDMNLIWETAAQAVRCCVEWMEQEDVILGVSVTGQGGGIFPVDKYGRPTRAGVASLDSRTGEMLSELREWGIAEWWEKETGNRINESMPLLMLKWFKIHEPEAYEKTEHILFSKDWVRYCLTGEYATDITDAAPPALILKDEKSYILEGFDRLGISEKKHVLPRIQSSFSVAGYVTKAAADKTGLKEGTPVITGAHDMMACCMGIGSVKNDFMLSLIGTWGANYTVTENRQQGLSNPHMIPGYYISGYLDGNSGAVLDRMLKILYERPGIPFCAKDYYAEAEERAGLSIHDDLIFLPHLFGDTYNQKMSGEIYGLKNWHNGNDVLKAIYEGIVMCHYENCQREIEGIKNVKQIYLGGGGGKSKLFAQLFADIFHCPVYIPDSSELTARGCALAVLHGLGIKKEVKDALIPVGIKTIYEPDEERRQPLMEKYQKYSALLKDRREKE